jgi:hypothetical protein
MSTAPVSAHPESPTPEDLNAITATARDYIEGWLDGDPERMRRCLHPDLVKRMVRRDPDTGEWIIGRIADAAAMIGWTEAGEGRTTDEAGRPYEIVVDAVFHRIATVRLVSSPFVDYLHVAKVGERWLIVHALWEPRAAEG